MPRGVYQGDKQICRNAKGLTSNSTAIDPGIFLYCKYLSDEIFVHDYRAKLPFAGGIAGNARAAAPR